MTKKFFLLVLLVISGVHAAKPILVLGVFNLSGRYRVFEESARKGVELRILQINKSGGLLGKYPLELAILDTQSDPEKVAALVQEKIEKDNFVAVVGFCDTEFVSVLAPILKKNNISLITPGATDPELNKILGKHLTMVSFDDQDQAYAISHFVHERLKAKKIVVWTEKKSDYARSISRFFIEAFRRVDKGEVLYESFFSFEDQNNDVKELIKRLEDTVIPVDAIFISANNPDILGKIIKMIRQSSLSLPILGTDSMDAKTIISTLTPRYANNIFYSTHARNPQSYYKFMEAYKSRYGEKPRNSFAALGYDAVGILANAITQTGATSKEEVSEALEKLNTYSGATGSFTYHASDHAPLKPVAILSIQAGNVSHLLDWDPSGRLLPTEFLTQEPLPQGNVPSLNQVLK